MDKIDHVALQVANIRASIEWYTKAFDCQVLYEDQSWALLGFENMKIALVIPSQHPAHLAVIDEHPEKYGIPKKHRDGTESVYVTDPDGNQLERIRYPKKLS